MNMGWGKIGGAEQKHQREKSEPQMLKRTVRGEGGHQGSAKKAQRGTSDDEQKRPGEKIRTRGPKPSSGVKNTVLRLNPGVGMTENGARV